MIRFVGSVAIAAAVACSKGTEVRVPNCDRVEYRTFDTIPPNELVVQLDSVRLIDCGPDDQDLEGRVFYP